MNYRIALHGSTPYHRGRLFEQRRKLLTPECCVWEHLLAMENSSTARLQQRPKRTTSVRLENLERLERVVREFGFKDRSHFFQMCTDALIRAHSESQQLDWPPRFATRKECDHQ
jgi:hypothetical protein